MTRTELNGLIRAWIRENGLVSLVESSRRFPEVGGLVPGVARFYCRQGRYHPEIIIRSTCKYLNDPDFVAQQRAKFSDAWEPTGYEYPGPTAGIPESELPTWLATHAWVDGKLFAR
jgi:hypothetical protein